MQEATLQTEGSLEYDLERTLAELDDFDGKYPKAAIAAARRQRDAISPRLIQAIEDAVNNLQRGEEVEGNAAFFSLLLLGEFGVKEALPSILRALTLPGEQPFDLFGDSIHEHVPAILAALADSPDVLDRIIDDTSLNEYVRASAVSGYLHFVFDGRLSRSDAVRRLQQHLRNSIERRDAPGATWQVCYLYDLSPREALQEIQEAYRLQLVDEGLLDLDSITESLAQSNIHFAESLAEIARRREVLPADYVECFGWNAGDERLPQPAVPTLDQDDRDAPFFDDDDNSDEDFAPPNNPAVGTIRYTEARVGRNDPCPCGSGRKFKKCCGCQ